MARRIRQHVNPLGARFAAPRAIAALPADLDPQRVVEVELGCAEGEFALRLAAAHPERFVVGLDIRERILARARAAAGRRGLGNVAFAYVNLGVDLDRALPPGRVDRFHLLFPDPWFKAKHRKRRVLDEDACGAIASCLRPGGELHAASDVFDVALDVMAALEARTDRGWTNLVGPWRFARESPVGVTSRREDATVAHGGRVWRLRFRHD
jgi:tRNA (guanine-N7-)-methyltransferase